MKSYSFETHLILALFLFSTFCAAVCNAQAQKTYFVIAPGARDIDQRVFQGNDQLIYRLEAEYPASDALDLIKARLAKFGWKPLKEDWLNPGLPNSIVRGWMFFEDQTTKPKSTVWTWQSDWINSTGDVLLYSLEYRCPGDLCRSTYNLHDLRVLSIHIPAELAERMKQESATQK